MCSLTKSPNHEALGLLYVSFTVVVVVVNDSVLLTSRIRGWKTAIISYGISTTEYCV